MTDSGDDDITGRNRTGDRAVAPFAPDVQTLIQRLPLVLWSIDPDGVITASEGRGLTALGLKAGEIVGRNVFDLYAAVPAVLEPIRSALHGEEGHSRVQIEGSHWENHYFPVSDNGAVVGLVGLSVDVTAQHKAEAALLRSEQVLQSLTEFSPDYISVVDRNRRVIFLNRRGANEFGQALGESVFDFVAPEHRAEAQAVIDEVFENGGYGEYEAYSVEPDGTSRCFQNRVSSMTTEGDNAHVIIVATDITERRINEREREQLRAQVQHAQKLESLGVLAGGIAHDFNNLLVSMMGHADLATMKLDGHSPAIAHIQEISTAASRAALLCDQMLAYAGRGRFELRHLDLSKLANEMGQLLEVSLGRGLTLERHLDEHIAPIEGDPAQIQQVLMNLITNASDAMTANGTRAGRVALRTGHDYFDEARLEDYNVVQELQPGEYAFVEVTDTGCGMDEETRLRMFDPFFSTKVSGRGLGMASVLGIVRVHGGSLSVQSELGEGTTIRVLIPVKPGAIAHQHPIAESRSRAPSFGRGRTVLVADDEPSVRKVAEMMLEVLGFQYVSVENGQRAVETYAAAMSRFDLVILDLTMPVMGGLDALAALRRIDPDARILLSSGYQQDEIPVDPQVRMLRKPYLLADMRSLIEATLATGPTPAQSDT